MNSMLTSRHWFVLGARGVGYTLCSLLLAVAVGLVSLRLHGQSLLSVQSASMTPNFAPGDALVMQPVRPSQLRVGDIVSYQSRQDPAVIISHRLIAINAQNGLLTTAGDRLGLPDKPFQSSRVVGRATAVAPGLGRAIDAVRKPLGLAILIYLPATAVVASEIRRLAVSGQRPFYRHATYHATPGVKLPIAGSRVVLANNVNM